MSGAKKRNEELHELLCAYILGEADESGRTEIEAALAASAELRAEKERLEGTIGLVREVYGGEPTLSEGALAELMDAAGASESTNPFRSAPARPLWSRPAFRAAAAVIAMTGGVWGLLQLAEMGSMDVSTSLELAQAEPKTAADRVLAEVDAITTDARERLVVHDLLGFGQSTGDPLFALETEERDVGRVPSFTSADAEAPLPVGEKAEFSGQHLYDKARKLSRPAKVDRLASLSEDLSFGIQLAVPPPEHVGMLGVELKKESADFFAANPFTAGVQGTRTKQIEFLKVVGKSAIGSDDFFLGRGAGSVPTVQRVNEVTVNGVVGGADGIYLSQLGGAAGSAGDLRARAKGTYRGPGDSTVIGGAKGGGGAQGPSGPGSPGPASPGARAGAPRAGPTSPNTRVGSRSSPSTGGSSPSSPRSQGAAASLRAARVELPGLGYGGGHEVANDEGVDLDGAVNGWIGGADNKARYFSFTQGGLSSEELIERECRTRIFHCYRRPNERPSAMFFRFWGDNAFELAQLDALSTFSVDVDTASYALARRYIEAGKLPEKAQIRTEEFLNYFKPDVDAPTEATFAIATELAPSLFGGREDRWLLRVGVRGREVSATERKPLALTFVVDTSGSMKGGGRLELVKHSLRLLLGQLDARDSIAIVAFSREARLILPMTSAVQRGLIESAIYPLTPSGGTNAESGLKMGYEVALSALASGVHNRVVFLSDGVANIGQTDQDRLTVDVKRHREQGIYLNTIGVGMGNHNDVFLEQLADKGDGICDYFDDAEAARRAIVDRFTGAFEPIASDVKIQVEFDPNQVHRYRLLGYENRAIADQDFRNDKVDAGEVGAGHQIVALYEIERTSAAADGPLATVRLRWKAPKVAGQDPNEVDVTEIEHTVLPQDAAGSFGATSTGFRRSVLVAQFAEYLRRSSHTLGDSYELLMVEAAKLDSELADSDFTEFRSLVERAAHLIVSTMHPRSELDRALDEFRRFQILQAELKNLKHGSDGKLLEDLKRKNQELEDSLRRMIRKDLEERNG